MSVLTYIYTSKRVFCTFWAIPDYLSGQELGKNRVAHFCASRLGVSEIHFGLVQRNLNQPTKSNEVNERSEVTEVTEGV